MASETVTRSALRRLQDRILRLEQQLVLLRVNQVTPSELSAVWGRRIDVAADGATELEVRLIALVDLVWARMPLPDAGGREQPELFIEQLYCEMRETLASAGMRIDVPAGRFDPKVAQAVEIVPAASADEHLTIADVRRPAVVRETARGTVAVRPAAVVVRDQRISARRSEQASISVQGAAQP
ncbi:MAG: hypothetical protein HY369_03675 [Candidatus Aenigmarchaeota archaeon]|nr:hypothetical protein [Candidatus Aenigmarchaeota archaeon]